MLFSFKYFRHEADIRIAAPFPHPLITRCMAAQHYQRSVSAHTGFNSMPVKYAVKSSPLSKSKSKSKSKLYYERRPVGRYILLFRLHLAPKSRSCCCKTVAGLLMWDVLHDERADLWFTIAACIANAAILGSESRGAHHLILLSQVQYSFSLERQVPIFISAKKRVAQFYP
jgi:hypothetical protein